MVILYNVCTFMGTCTRTVLLYGLALKSNNKLVATVQCPFNDKEYDLFYTRTHRRTDR